MAEVAVKAFSEDLLERRTDFGITPFCQTLGSKIFSEAWRLSPGSIDRLLEITKGCLIGELYQHGAQAEENWIANDTVVFGW
jgi:hypothetical protein